MNSVLNEDDKKEANKIATQQPIDFLLNYSIGEINIGQIAYRNYLHYMIGPAQIFGENENLYRRCFESSFLIYIASKRIINRLDPEFMVTANGKFIQTAIPSQIMNNIEIPVIISL